MTTKLTLTLDDKVIKSAKVYAKTKGKSLSHLIENYLKTITMSTDTDKPVSASISKWKGSIKLPADFDYKKVISQSLSKKYK